MIARTSWDQLPDEVREAVRARTGPVRSATDASAGKNSAIAVILHAERGKIFVKGLPKDHPGVVTQSREAMINPYVKVIGPTLLWHADVQTWDLLAFAHLGGRHASYRPGSTDIPKIVHTMRRLASLPCPELPQIKRAEQRWATFVDDPRELALLAGPVLLHTDYNPDNVLIRGGRARLIDWAWPTLGAAFIDPACFVVRLIAAGHSPAEAEAQVAGLPAWADSAQQGINVFSLVLERMWASIADAEPSSEWKAGTAAAAHAWSKHRQAITAA